MEKAFKIKKRQVAVSVSELGSFSSFFKESRGKEGLMVNSNKYIQLDRQNILSQLEQVCLQQIPISY